MAPGQDIDYAELLRAASAGSDPDVAALRDAVYSQLRAIAGAYFREQRPEHTLQPTALVNEVFVRMIGSNASALESRAHFLAVAAKAMRHILIDHARRKRAEKRGGAFERVTLSGVLSSSGENAYDAIDVDEALAKLAEINERQARVVELRFFAGLKVAEVASLLGVSDRTVEMDWRMARAWLRRELGEMPG
ncbi:MAG: sigma-70 family RNA polymerase sigma factor [Phycisphaeraceae bacterium]|nr:MAG: sigma-70 family RNA polymerase sigma factor [Phycisphaeraceae bacterium]